MTGHAPELNSWPHWPFLIIALPVYSLPTGKRDDNWSRDWSSWSPVWRTPWHLPCQGSARCSCWRCEAFHRCWLCPCAINTLSKFRNKFIQQNKAKPVEIHVGADGSTALESAQVGISCILNIKTANCSTLTLNQPKLTNQVKYQPHLISPTEVHVAADALGVPKLLDCIFSGRAWTAHGGRGTFRPGGI